MNNNNNSKAGEPIDAIINSLKLKKQLVIEYHEAHEVIICLNNLIIEQHPETTLDEIHNFTGPHKISLINEFRAVVDRRNKVADQIAFLCHQECKVLKEAGSENKRLTIGEATEILNVEFAIRNNVDTEAMAKAIRGVY